MKTANSRAFISYSHKDKDFVSKLVSDLGSLGAHVWLDLVEMRVGDSIIQKIQSAIEESEWLIVVLSPDSVESNWVKRELSAALMKELEAQSVYVLPLLYRDCSIPIMLRDKVYADFTRSYEQGLQSLAERLAPEHLRFKSYLVKDGNHDAILELLSKNHAWIAKDVVPQHTLSRIQDLLLESPRMVSAVKEAYQNLPHHYLVARSAAEDILRGVVSCEIIQGIKNWETTVAFLVRTDLLNSVQDANFVAAIEHSLIMVRLYYLCSPYKAPFEDDFRPSRCVQETLEKAKHLIEGAILPHALDIPEGHYGLCGSLMHVTVFAGQRHHYGTSAQDARQRLQDTWRNGFVDERIRRGIRLKIPTYTRLLDSIEGRPAASFNI